MVSTTKALVLHQVKYSDTKNIVHLFTEQYGRMAVMVDVGKEKRLNRKSPLQSLSIIGITINYNETKSLHHLNEYEYTYIYSDIPYNPTKRAIVLFLGEVLNKFLKEEVANTNLFYFIESSFIYLDAIANGSADFHIIFLFYLSKYLGIYPQNNHEEGFFFDLYTGHYAKEKPSHNYILQPNEALLFSKFQNIRLDEIHLHSSFANGKQRLFILRKMIEYFNIHLLGGSQNNMELFSTIFSHI